MRVSLRVSQLHGRDKCSMVTHGSWKPKPEIQTHQKIWSPSTAPRSATPLPGTDVTAGAGGRTMVVAGGATFVMAGGATIVVAGGATIVVAGGITVVVGGGAKVVVVTGGKG